VGAAIAGALAEKAERDKQRKEAERLAAEEAQRLAMEEAQRRRDEAEQARRAAFERAKQAAYSEMLGLKPDDSLQMMDPFASAGAPADCDQDTCLAGCPTVGDTLGGRKVEAACVQRCLALDCSGAAGTSGGDAVRVPGTELRESDYFMICSSGGRARSRVRRRRRSPQQSRSPPPQEFNPRANRPRCPRTLPLPRRSSLSGTWRSSGPPRTACRRR
jgi:hypothetical protein